MKAIKGICVGIMGMVAAALGCGAAQAKTHHVVTLRNGTTLSGDIVSQDPGTSMTVDIDSAVFVIPDRLTRKKTPKKVKYENLSKEWKRWVLQHKALEGDVYARYVTLYDIRTADNKYTSLIKKNPSNAKDSLYIQVTPGEYKIKWKDIAEIDTRRKAFASQLMDEVKTAGGKTYRGNIVSQKPGETLSIKTSGRTVKVNAADITETKKVTKDGKQPKFADFSDYTNTIKLKNGKEKAGVILSQHSGSKSKDNYLMLLTDADKTEKIMRSDIAAYNTKFKGKKNAYRQGATYVNEFRISPAKTKTERGFTAFVDKQVYPFPEGIEITFKSSGDRLEDGWELVALGKQELKSGATAMGYDAEIRKNNLVRPVKTGVEDGMDYIRYNYLSPGYYALISRADRKSYIIKIVK